MKVSQIKDVEKFEKRVKLYDQSRQFVTDGKVLYQIAGENIHFDTVYDDVSSEKFIGTESTQYMYQLSEMSIGGCRVLHEVNTDISGLPETGNIVLVEEKQLKKIGLKKGEDLLRVHIRSDFVILFNRDKTAGTISTTRKVQRDIINKNYALLKLLKEQGEE